MGRPGCAGLSFVPSTKARRLAGARSVELSQQIFGGHGPRLGAVAGQAVGGALEQLVDRRRNAVLASEQDDLAVEVVGLDGAGAASQALLRRTAAPALAVDRADADEVAAARTVLLLGGRVDTSGGEARVGLGTRPGVQLGARIGGRAALGAPSGLPSAAGAALTAGRSASGA